MTNIFIKYKILISFLLHSCLLFIPFYAYAYNEIPEETIVYGLAPIVVTPETNQPPAAPGVADGSEHNELHISLNGEAQMAVGITPKDFIWRRANPNLTDDEWRFLSVDGLNNKENTFDPSLYSYLKLILDATKEDAPLSFHTNISIDPWSFTGTSKKTTITGMAGDSAELQVLYAANTQYTIGQTIPTLIFGDAFSLPELKVTGGRVMPATITSTFGNIFTLTETKLDYEFQPIRELWFDYTPDPNKKTRVFLMAKESMALTSDDPLRLSNNKIYWEESPWLANWQPGNFNSLSGDFTKGSFDDSLASSVWDSHGEYLTALRGISFDLEPSDGLTVNGVLASPKTLWQDYESFQSVPASVRIKNSLSDTFYVGGLTNLHLGLTGPELDAYNSVVSLDSGFSPLEGIKFEAQVSSSFSRQDITNETFETHKRGNAYYLGLITSTLPQQNILKNDYYRTRSSRAGGNHYTHQLYFARMDDGFESTLSNYRQTREDSFWSRHIHFKTPFSNYFDYDIDNVNYDEIEPYGLGTGLDIGRYVFGFRSDLSFWSNRLRGSSEVRNVHLTNNKILETVIRSRWTHQTTDRLTTQFLLIRQEMPETTEGIDPFIYSNDTGEFFVNSAIPDGEDPSLSTLSLGAEYKWTDWLSTHGAWEFTNDFTVAAENFPQSILNANAITTYEQDGNTFRKALPYLYYQGFFDLPPYEYHNIFRAGMRLIPHEKWNIYLNYTRNPNKFAGQIDNNMNHIGLDITYKPSKNLGMLVNYTWAKTNDIYRLVFDNEIVYESHHNVFAELYYNISATDALTLQYGVGASSNLTSRFIGSMPTLDTQHLVRLFYKKTF